MSIIIITPPPPPPGGRTADDDELTVRVKLEGEGSVADLLRQAADVLDGTAP